MFFGGFLHWSNYDKKKRYSRPAVGWNVWGFHELGLFWRVPPSKNYDRRIVLDGGSQFGGDGQTIFTDSRLSEIWRELALHYFWAEYFRGSWLGGDSQIVMMFRRLSKIGRELALHYFPVDCFGGIQLGDDGQTIFTDSRLSEIWRELALHYFQAYCFGIDFFQIIWDLAGTGSTLFLGGIFWRQLIGWWRPNFDDVQTIISDLAGTGSTLFSGGLFWRHPTWWWWRDYFYGQQVIWDLVGTGITLFSGVLFWDRFFSDYKPIEATLQRHFFGGEGGAWYKRV